MADIFSRFSKFKTFLLRFKSKIKPIEDELSSSETTSVSLNSLNESNIESIEEYYRRDSFDDQFCDDLCEDILQFLSLEDKLRFECVSKQFQRTVFQRHYDLHINTCPKDHKFKQIFQTRRENTNYYYIDKQSLHSIKSLLKKCPNITSIKLNGPNFCYPGYDSIKVNDVFRLIIKNCNNLSEIQVLNHILLYENIFEEFHKKFGPKIKYLSYRREFIDLSRFPNIEKIKILKSKIDESIIPQLKTNKLKELEITFNQGQEHMLQLLIATFPTLTHLELDFLTKDKNAIYKSLKNISNLKKLIHFKVHNVFDTNDEQFYYLLQRIAYNCRNLKSIDFDFNIERNNSDVIQFLSQIKSFPALKRLNLRFRFYSNEDKDNIDVNHLVLFEIINDFSNITHLSLAFNKIRISEKWIIEESNGRDLSHFQRNVDSLIHRRRQFPVILIFLLLYFPFPSILNPELTNP